MRLTRGEFDDMLRPAIGETVSATRRVLESSGVEPGDLSAIVLVGGSSRIPLVSEMLSAAFGRPLALDNHPKHDVALGAAIRGTPAAQPQTAPARAAGGSGRGAGDDRRGGSRRTAPAAREPPPAGSATTGPGPRPGRAPAGTVARLAPARPRRPDDLRGRRHRHATRLPAAVRGTRGRMLVGTGAVVVALAVGAGI